MRKSKNLLFMVTALTLSLVSSGPAMAYSLPDTSGPPPGVAVDDPHSEALLAAPRFPTGATRLSGPDRYQTAVAISARYPARILALYVATGENFPDALSASAAAGNRNVPILLTRKNSLPANVLEEVIRLSPQQIFLVGGSDSVSDSVEKALAEIAPVHRLAGDTRYETSLKVVDNGFGITDDTFLASGADFPDALSAAGAAGRKAAPVILIDGEAAEIPSDVLDFFTSRGVSQVAVLGAEDSLKRSFDTQLTKADYTVTRLGGKDRYETSALINAHFFPISSHTIMEAGGENFPDALAGGALAGFMQVPIYLTKQDCTPSPVSTILAAQPIATKVIVGGTDSISDNAVANVGCP